MIRLDKYLATNTQLSRREVLYAVRQKLITVNGLVATRAAQKINLSDIICLNEEVIDIRGNVYLMLHKPAGVVSVTRDHQHPTALDLLDFTALNLDRAHTLQIAGRLDIDTTGLLLITDDGVWNHRLTAPAAGKLKRYRVQTENPIVADTEKRFADGLMLRNEKQPTLPASLTVLDTHEALLEIREGRYHQIKRMFAATGNRVTGLHREAVGTIELDPCLAPGQYRPLTPGEIDSV